MSKKNVFLVAYYYMKPQVRVKTQIKGWKENQNNIRYDEQVAITRSLKNRDVETSKIILDLKNKKIVKNGWGNSKTFDDLFGYYLNGYPQYAATIMSELDPEYLASFSHRKAEETEKPGSGTGLSST